MIWKIAFLLLFSLFSINSVSAGGGGSGVTFTITNEAVPGTRPPPPPIQDLIEGPIGRDYYTKVDGGVYIQADYSIQGIPEQEVYVRWFKDGVPIAFNQNRQGDDNPPVNYFSITSSIELFPGDNVTRVYQDRISNADSTGSAFLYLTDIDPRFVGNYTFEVYSGSDTASASSNVILGTPPELITTPPDSIDPPRDGFNQIDLNLLTESRVTCDTGSDVYATFNGDPAPNVTCTDTLGAGEQVSQTNTDSLQTSVRYTVPALSVSTQTIVTCTAVNDFGTATKVLTLISFGSPPRLPSSLPPARVACTRADAVVSVREDQIACGLINEGQITITLSLGQEGIPPFTVRWWQRDTFGVVRGVTEGGRYTITRQGQNRVLTIQSPQKPADEGDYWIVAENCAGSVNTESTPTTVELYMRPDIGPMDPVIPPEGSCQNNPAYTTINVQGVDIVVTDDSPVCITCPSTGVPPPGYSWLRDGSAFAPNQGPSNAAYLDTTGLVFRDQPNCFQCSATNIAGVDTSEVCVQLGLPLAYRVRNNGCTTTCRGGVIDYALVCVEIQVGSETVVDTSLCIAQQIVRPPIPTTICGEVACPPQFLLGAWSTCSSSCEEGVRTRTVRCRQIGSNGIQTDVAISVCEAAGLNAPESSEACNVARFRRTGNLNPCPVFENFEFETSPWSACTQSCHKGRRTRTVRCREIDRVSGRGYGRVYDDEVCIRLGHVKPLNIQVCGSGPCNQFGSWLSFPWGPCSSSCGAGARSREIICYDTLTRSESNNCQLSHRPASFQTCSEGPCLLTPECIDSRGIQCSVLRYTPGLCEVFRYVRVCCKTCEDIIY